jgi:hypothetical protein
MIAQKPPLGIRPEYIHKQERAEDIASALVRYVENEHYRDVHKNIQAWCSELSGLVQWLEENQERDDLLEKRLIMWTSQE